MVGGIIRFKVTQVHSNELWRHCVKLDRRMREPVGKLSSGVELLCVANKNKLGFGGPYSQITRCQKVLTSKLSTGISDEEIMKLNLPTGMPFFYELDANLKPVVSMQFYSDKETVEKAMALVASISHRAPQ